MEQAVVEVLEQVIAELGGAICRRRPGPGVNVLLETQSMARVSLASAQSEHAVDMSLASLSRSARAAARMLGICDASAVLSGVQLKVDRLIEERNADRRANEPGS